MSFAQNPWDRLGWVTFPGSAGLGMGIAEAPLEFLPLSAAVSPLRSQDSHLASFSLPWQWFQSQSRPWSVDCV